MKGKKDKKVVGVPDNHFPSLLTNLSSLQSREKFTDVVFLCRGGEQRSVLFCISITILIFYRSCECSQSHAGPDIAPPGLYVQHRLQDPGSRLCLHIAATGNVIFSP